jgi:hypothetical protein
MKLPLFFDINRDLHIKYVLRAIEDLAHDLPVKISTGIAIVEKGIAFIVQVAWVVAGETENVSALSIDPIQLKLQVDRAAVVFDPHQINRRLTIAPGQMPRVTREQRHLLIDKTLNILRIRNRMERPYIE